MPDRYRPFLLGLAGALAGIFVVILIGLAIVVWNRAANGQQAFEYLTRELAKQQQQAPKSAPLPGKE